MSSILGRLPSHHRVRQTGEPIIPPITLHLRSFPRLRCRRLDWTVPLLHSKVLDLVRSATCHSITFSDDICCLISHVQHQPSDNITNFAVHQLRRLVYAYPFCIRNHKRLCFQLVYDGCPFARA